MIPNENEHHTCVCNPKKYNLINEILTDYSLFFELIRHTRLKATFSSSKQLPVTITRLIS